MPVSGDEDGPREVERHRTFGEIGEDVQRGERKCRALQRGNRRRQLGEHRLVEGLFARERAVLRRQRAILERLQLGRDVPFGVLERLPAPVVVGHPRGVHVGDLDVEPVHLVVLDLQVGDARALALARLQRDQELAAIRIDRAQLVELGVVAGGDHAAVADLRGGFGRDRPLQQGLPAAVDVEVGGERLRERRGGSHGGLPDRGKPRQRVAQPREIARPRRGERDARRDSLDVRGPAEQRRDRAARRRVVAPCGDDGVSRPGFVVAAQRMQQPLPQQPASRRGRAVIEQRQQRRRRIAAQRRADLEVAARRGVELQVVARRAHGQRAHVRQFGLLRRCRVAQHGARGTEREIAVVDAERGEVARAEVPAERAGRCRRVELPRGQVPDRYGRCGSRVRAPFRHQQFGRVELVERLRGIGGAHFGDLERARREIEPREPGAVPAGIDRHEQRCALRVEKIRIGHRPRRHHAHHLALDRSLARRRIADLLADRHGLAEAHQSGEVLLDGVERDPGHRDRRSRRLSARGQRDVEQRRGAARIVVEELVEIAHPVEQQLVRVLRLGAEVLLHHRRCARTAGRREGSGRGRHGGAIIDRRAARPAAFARDCVVRRARRGL